MSNNNTIKKEGYGVYTKMIIGDETEDNELVFGLDSISYLLIHDNYIDNELPLILIKLAVPFKLYRLLQEKVNINKTYIEDINLNIYCTEDKIILGNEEEDLTDVTYQIIKGYHNMIGFIDTIDTLTEEQIAKLNIDEEDSSKESFVIRLALMNKSDLSPYTKGLTNGIYKNATINQLIQKSFIDTINKDINLYMEDSHNKNVYDNILITQSSFKQNLFYLDEKKDGIYNTKYKIYIKSNIMYLYPVIGNLKMTMNNNIRKDFRKNIEVTLLDKTSQVDIEEIYEDTKTNLRIGYPYNKSNKSINYFPIYTKYINRDELSKLQISKEDTDYIIHNYKVYSSSNVKDINNALLNNKKLSMNLSSISPSIDFYPDNIITVIDSELNGKYRVIENFQIFTKSGYQKSINLLKIE